MNRVDKPKILMTSQQDFPFNNSDMFKNCLVRILFEPFLSSDIVREISNLNEMTFSAS